MDHPLLVLPTYQQAAIHATLAGTNRKALYWRLAMDEATLFSEQSTFFSFPKISFAHERASRLQADQEALVRHTPPNSMLGKKTSWAQWMFSDDVVTRQATSSYRYWIARSTAETSPHCEQEIATITALLKKDSDTTCLLQEILALFAIVRDLEKQENSSIEHAILLHRSKTVAFTASYLATTQQQLKDTTEKELFPFLKNTTHSLEQELLLRKKIVNATKQEKEEEALFLALAANAWNIATDFHRKEISFFSTKNEAALLRSQQASQLAVQAAIELQRLVESLIVIPKTTGATYLEHALFLSKNAFEYRMQTLEAEAPFHEIFSPRWQRAADKTDTACAWWKKAARTAIAFPSWEIVHGLQKAMARRAEYKSKSALQQIALHSNIQFGLHSFKEPTQEKKRYQQETMQAILAQNEPLATAWRLAAEEADYFYDHRQNFCSQKIWEDFVQQFFSKKKPPLLLLLHGLSLKNDSYTQHVADDEYCEAILQIRYWMLRAHVTIASLDKEISFQQLLTLHRRKKAASAATHLQELKEKNTDTASLQKAIYWAEQSFLFRTKAAEVTEKEFEASQWTLIAYLAEQLTKGYQQFFEHAHWEERAKIAKQAIKCRLQALKIDHTGDQRQAHSFRKAASLLEIIFEQEINLFESPQTAAVWNDALRCARDAAILWMQEGRLKKRNFKRTAHQKEKEMRQKLISLFLKKISFCLPAEALPDAACREAWSKGKLVPRLEFTVFYSWIYQTWNLLQQAGVSTHLSTQLLEQGTTITWGFYLLNSLGMEKKFPENIFLVDVMADRLPHPGAHLYLTQNRTYARYAPHTLFIPHWPQRNLIPRNPKRGARFEYVAFLGDVTNIAPELQSEAWRERLLKELGITFFIQGNLGWHDYSGIDAVVAIRDFSKSRHRHKPATKLYNAWNAGVPFIGGRDSAYAAEGTSGENYLVATSLEEVFQHLKRLKEDTALRNKLVENGRRLGPAFTHEKIMAQWKILLQKTIPSHVAAWQKKSALERYWFFFINRLLCFLNYYLQ